MNKLPAFGWSQGVIVHVIMNFVHETWHPGLYACAFMSAYCPLRWSRCAYEKWGPSIGHLPDSFQPKCLLRDLLNISWKPVHSVSGDGKGSLLPCLYSGYAITLLVLLFPNTSWLTFLFTFLHSLLMTKTCTPPSETLDLQGTVLLAYGEGRQGAAPASRLALWVTCGSKK